MRPNTLVRTAGIVLCAASCTRPAADAVAIEWNHTTIATYCETKMPCPPAMLDLGTAGHDTVYGGVPASGGPMCGSPASEYRLSATDIDHDALDYSRLSGSPPDWISGSLPLATLQPGLCNHLLLRHTTMGLTSVELTGASALPDPDNDTFADADDLSAGAPVDGKIDPAGDIDYYRITAKAGEWWYFNTVANPEDDPDALDTVISLYDESLQLVARNDDEQPRYDTDSELVYRIPADGYYYLRVEDYFTSAIVVPGTEEAPRGGPTSTYQLTAFAVAAGDPYFAFETQTSSQPVTLSPNRYLYVLGDLSSSDTDRFTLMPFSNTDTLRMYVPNAGAESGSTVTDGAALIDTPTATAPYLARIERGVGFDTLVVPSSGVQNFVVGIDAPSDVGTNPFYVLKLDAYTFVGRTETFDQPNNVLATAEATMATNGTAWLQTELPTLTDVDHWSFTAAGGSEVSVFCYGEQLGSGVRGLTVDVLDSTGAVLPNGTASEMGTSPAHVGPLPISTSGTYYVKLHKTGQDSAINGYHARCAITSR